MMPTTKMPAPEEVELKLNISEQIAYYIANQPTPQLKNLVGSVFTREAIITFFNELKESTGNKIYLCFPVDEDSDMVDKLTVDTSKIYGSGRIVDINKREVVFMFKIIPTYANLIKRLSVHMRNISYERSYGKQPKILFARVVGVVK